jgi:hypothetical protein
MQERDAQRVALESELAGLAAVSRTASLADHVAVAADLRVRFAEWRDLLRQDVAWAQPLLRELIPERLTVTRTAAGVRVTGLASLGLGSRACCTVGACPGGSRTPLEPASPG